MAVRTSESTTRTATSGTPRPRTAAAAGATGTDSGDPSSFTAYTLVIQDPQDAQHYIICHHRALRNMVQAFMKALSILDPDTPLPSPPAALMAPCSTATPLPAGVGGAAGYGGHSLPPSAAMGRTTSDIVYPSSLITLPSHHHNGNGPSTPPSATHTFASSSSSSSSASSHSAAPFHRLLDVQAAYAGPAMKDCPSVQCRYTPPTHTVPHTEQSLLHLRLHVRQSWWRRQHEAPPRRPRRQAQAGHGGAWWRLEVWAVWVEVV